MQIFTYFYRAFKRVQIYYQKKNVKFEFDSEPENVQLSIT